MTDVFDQELKKMINEVAEKNIEIFKEEVLILLRYPKTEIHLGEDGRFYLVGPRNRIREFEQRYFTRCMNEVNHE